MNLGELGRLVKSIAYLEGDFTLRSGQKSKYYLDKYLFETHYDVLDKVTTAFQQKIQKEYGDFDLLAAPELGAVSLVAALSIKLKKNFVIVRKDKKDYGTSKQIEGNILGVKKVLIVEDILTTGGAAIKSADAIKEAGLEVIAILGTIDRLQGAQKCIEDAGYKYDTLLTIKDMGL